MKIAVCVKQVPVAAASQVGDSAKQGKSLQRTGIEAMLNPFDTAALEAALQLKAMMAENGQTDVEREAEIDVFTMGPLQAGAVLSQAFSLGADRGFLISSPHFAGADVLATSYTLAQAMHRTPYDVVICGKQSTDGDTGQVGPSLAAQLGIHHVHNVERVIGSSSRHLQLCQRTALYEQTVSVPMPALLVVNLAAFPCRVPSLKHKLAARQKTWQCIGLEDLVDHDPGRYGLAGSATEVERVYVPRQRATPCHMLTGSDEAITEQLLRTLREVACDV